MEEGSSGWLGVPGVAGLSVPPWQQEEVVGAQALGMWGALVGVAEQSKCLSLELQKAPC